MDARYDITYGRIADYNISAIAKRLAVAGDQLWDLNEILNPSYAFHTERTLDFIRPIGIEEVLL